MMNIELEVKTSLAYQLMVARKECGYAGEEEGGFLLESLHNEKDDSPMYLFVKVANKNKGLALAVALYSANEVEFGEKVLGYTTTGNWRIFASFHTHPGTSVQPSRTDLTQLFTSFGVNYIYSPMSGELACYVLCPMADMVQAMDNQGRTLKGKVWVPVPTLTQ
jgi:hypothetical protein